MDAKISAIFESAKMFNKNIFGCTYKIYLIIYTTIL
ncbi:hypothetical protein Bache_2109 [Bacteroides helcogenes P 36-108]|uniref:Uncharacterized protein n=1 Tax=Bacteroides helcogenes (strain ATCC 35417 / DSM 20613 / JCM 6297 / CCUG 15421 / P 36-108) TaxID=693979 RepID=E6SQ54_BACT6|nr:hypothetical protein Bache_1935 [Bacteroides helcogenes P 36-108]ADV44080.1 hypothetical protein Bache_2109 [Bacteroides helcogenes P 36-108]